MSSEIAVVEAVLGKLADLDRPVHAVDELELTAAERERAHLRARSRDQRELVISLPRRTELEEGDVVFLHEGVAVVVVPAREDLLEVTPRTEREWAVAAYQLGNLHRPVRLAGDFLLTPYDQSCAEVMSALGVARRRVTRGFVGERCRAPIHHTGQVHGVDGSE